MLIHFNTKADVKTPIVAASVLVVRSGLVACSAARLARGDGVVPVDLVMKLLFLG